MTDRHMKQDDSGDPRVSAAYREMAGERTPEHLDHVILNAARSAAKPRRSKTIAWLRPVAWAATIGVCLAIVIEIALLPEQGPAGIVPVSEDTASPMESKRLEKTTPQAAEPPGAQAVRKPARGKSADMDGRADEAEALNSLRELRQSSEIVEETAPASTLRSAPATATALEFATERYCDESQTADPESWLECILELERQGLYDAARLERELLAEAFPPPELVR
jgi:hypothetical protein